MRSLTIVPSWFFFFFQAEDGIRDLTVTGFRRVLFRSRTPRADPINAALALEGVRGLTSGLPDVVRDPQDLNAREQTLYGAYLAAVAFASAGSGLHRSEERRVGKECGCRWASRR